MRNVLKITLAVALLSPLTINTAAQRQSLAFEVASVKANSGSATTDTGFNPAGVTFRSSRLLDLIATAYQIPYSRISATEAGTRELFTTRYDVVATAGQQVTRDQLLIMLQNLLAERFKMKL